ncbi:MAG: hypothetical protein PHY28_05305 [Dehalococcoidales bacterium]|nr:hypothetical protein [Dehalococcoidales bacterium]
MDDKSQEMKREILKGSVSSDYDTLDSRHPEMYRDPVTEGTKIAVKWFEAFSQRNPEGMTELMHFPFIHADENTLTTIKSSQELLNIPPPFMNMRSIDKKDYDALDELRIPVFRPAEVGVFLNFDRYHSNGEKFLRGETLLCVRKNIEGKWGLQESSTILKPANQADDIDTETIEESRRILTLYMYSYGIKNQALLDAVGWPHGKMDYERFAKLSGSRIGGYDNTIAIKMEMPQHSANKAHCLTTFLRRQLNGRPITINRGIYVTAKQEGKWRWFLGGAYARTHDYSNDTASE